eukprot:s2332_g2.t2
MTCCGCVQIILLASKTEEPGAVSSSHLQRSAERSLFLAEGQSRIGFRDFPSNRPRPEQLKLEPDPSPGRAGSSRTESEDELEDELEEVNSLPTRQLSRRFSWSEYPTTPLFLDMSADKPKAPGTQPRIGIDIGGVLTRQGDRTYMGPLDEWDTTWEADGALDAVGKIAQVFGPSNTFLVSKVSPGKSMHRRMEQWLHETMDFCEVTGVPKDNIVFVSAVSGTQGKGVVCERLGISHFVDDKIEVLKSVFEDEGMEADTDDAGPQLQLPIQKAGHEDHKQSSSASALEILLEEAASQKLVEKGIFWTRTDEAALVGLVLQDEPESFQVVLRPITGCKLGLAVMEFGRKLLVAVVHPKGVVSTWNATYPDLSIEERDLLVQVNHATEYFGMVQQLRFSQVLLLKLQRQESIKSRPIPMRAKWEPRAGTGESSSDLDSSLALRAVTESLGPHSPSTWKSAASCIVEHFLHQEHLFLGFYGYRILTNRTWADCPVAGQTPILSLTVMQHIEQAGHTWYVVSCELMLFNAGERDLCSHSCALHVGTLACMIDDVLKWEAPRRLAQLRADLHDRVKFSMEPKEYKALFEEAPFAHAGGPSGTTLRLSNWLSALAASINKLSVTPAVASFTLTFLHAPLPPHLVRDALQLATAATWSSGSRDCSSTLRRAATQTSTHSGPSNQKLNITNVPCMDAPGRADGRLLHEDLGQTAWQPFESESEGACQDVRHSRFWAGAATCARWTLSGALMAVAVAFCTQSSLWWIGILAICLILCLGGEASTLIDIC